jgi:iron complex outermembrane receptor protein
MKKIVLILIIFSFWGVGKSQNIFKAYIIDEETKEPLMYANVVIEDTKIGDASDTTGLVIIKNIPNGKQTIVFSYVGYRPKEKTYIFPLKQKEIQTIYLEKGLDSGEIVVYSMRTNNRIKEIPTRIEVLGNEEVVEESGISPGNISKLLGETSGIQVQHTSAISGNVSFRIQGLPGKYTQLLQDGFPIYNGFSSGLSLLQIPPLDLQQVEIIKGSASTLFGSDAISGIVNLITKKPQNRPEFSVLFNQTHKGTTDFSSYYSAKKDKFGITMLASINTQKAMDVSGNSFSDIPRYNRAVFSPRIFYDINKNNHLYLGFSSVIEDRTGGDIKAINDEADSLHSFFEENKSKRFNTTFKYENKNNTGNIFAVKAAYGNFQRNLKTNINLFKGVQNNFFSEISYFANLDKHQWVSGINFYSDDFKQSKPDIFSLNYSYQTLGIFSQDNWGITDRLSIEPGIRYDYNIQNGGYFLPRLALMYKFSKKFFTRISAGMGYKLPTPFTDESERNRYQMVIMPSNLEVEKSTGINLDFNYKTPLFDELFLNINQAFFLTQIKNPIIINGDSLQNQVVYNENAAGAIFSKGLTTNIRLSIDELVLYIDYTYLNAEKSYDNDKQLERTPKNRLTTTFAYEDEEEGWKAGLEAFYFGNQYLENGNGTPDYWLLGASVQKTVGHITVALNVENILDIRQTRYENIVSGAIDNPVFNELFTPLDGIVGNIVVKFDLY